MDSPERIREAATRLFAREGFDGTSLQSIADEVGIAKQSLLYHYGSKAILRRAVLEQVFAHWRARLPELLDAVTGGHARFDLLTRELIGFFLQDADRARLVIRELLDRPEEMRQLMAENLQPWLLLVAKYIRRGQESDVLHPDIDPDSYVLHVITLVVATIANLPVLPAVLPAGPAGTDPGDRHLAELLRLVRSGLFRMPKETTP